MELWDAYSQDEKLTGNTLVRGEQIPDGVYHLVCNVIVRHTDGSYLCMKRSAQKPKYAGWYEATAGGSAIQGEDKWKCVERELLEETGLVCHEFEEIDRFQEEERHAFFYIFMCTVDCDKNSVQVQEGETEDYLWMSEEEFIEFVNSDRIIPSHRRRYHTYFQKRGYLK